MEKDETVILRRRGERMDECMRAGVRIRTVSMVF